ncbi:MAG: peptidoglycan/LPS O-acetylase OafA/YrhL [Saprospiraceae bacterium]
MKASMNKKRYFHTFDALRFLAVFLVFLTHAPLYGIPVVEYFKKSGGIGVQFFFTLSGFLITYIILFEKNKTGKINFKNFFIRRALRIWPLFYAMIAFAFATPFILSFLGLNASGEGYVPNWLASCLFLENYKMMFTDSFPNVSPLRVMWSLCIEEHFYLVWGILFYFIPIKKVPLAISIAIIVANLSRFYYISIGLATADLFTNIDYFAFGAIPAYCLIAKDSVIAKLNQVPGFIKYLVAIISLSYVFISPNIYFLYQEFIDPWIFGGLFSLLVFFTLPKKNRLFISDYNPISKAGIYTYGIYLYHTIVINLFLQLANKSQIDPAIPANGIVISILSLVVTIGISVASYHWFEKRFLKMKRYFY